MEEKEIRIKNYGERLIEMNRWLWMIEVIVGDEIDDKKWWIIGLRKKVVRGKWKMMIEDKFWLKII